VQLHFDEMRVPRANLLGDQSHGFIYAMQSLEHGRLGIAAQAIGIARAALEVAADYAAERRQFGKPIAEFQAIQFKLADMATRVTASRALLYAAAAAKDRGEPVTQFASMSKLMASETAMFVTTEAIQILGGYGYVTDYPVERYFRDAKVTQITRVSDPAHRDRARAVAARRWETGDKLTTAFPSVPSEAVSKSHLPSPILKLMTIFSDVRPGHEQRFHENRAAIAASSRSTTRPSVPRSAEPDSGITSPRKRPCSTCFASRAA
jgi:hypothetical protein